MEYLVGFIGYGEAAYNISYGLHREGVNNILAFDVMQDDIYQGKEIEEKAKSAGVKLASSLQNLCENCKFIISLTSPAVCVDVAKQALPFLRAGQIFCDLNSADPVNMRTVAGLPWPEGVKMVDVAVLGSVPKGKHKTKMYLSGDGAQDFYDEFIKWNMNLKVLNKPAGGASAIKMFKSVFSKGIMQILLEMYVSAAACGVLDEVVDLTKNTFKTRTVEDFANENLYRTLVHAKRRFSEMSAVVKTIKSLGYDASVSEATCKKLKMLAEQNYMEKIGNAQPDLRETVAMVVRDMKEN